MKVIKTQRIYAVISMIVFSILMFFSNPSRATVRNWESFHASYVTLVLCYNGHASIGWIENNWLYYRGLTQAIDAYFHHKVQHDDLQPKPLVVEVSCFGMGPLYEEEIREDDEQYRVHIHWRINLEQLVQVVNYLATEPWEPFRGEMTGKIGTEDLPSFLNNRVGVPEMAFFQDMRFVLVSIDSQTQIIYEPDHLWYLIDGTNLEVMNELQEFTVTPESSNEPLSPANHVVTWQGIIHTQNPYPHNGFGACSLATYAFRSAIYRMCGSLNNIAGRTIKDTCDCRFDLHDDSWRCIKKGTFFCENERDIPRK
jgi:hypothetical protein